MKILIPLLALLLVGCEEFYRYPCQDPANWGKTGCQRPACEIEGDCSDVLSGQKTSSVEVTEETVETSCEPEVQNGE